MADRRGGLHGAEDLPPDLRPLAGPGQGPPEQADRRRRPRPGQAELAGRVGRGFRAGHRVSSFDVRFWKIEARKGKGTTYRVRWVVAGRPFSESFLTMALAESFRAKLITAAR